MNKNIYIIGTLTLCAAAFTACSDDEEYDFPGDSHNRVYTPDQSTAYKIIQTPAGAIGSLDCKIPAKCNKIAASDIKVTMEVDNSLIDAYNELYGTQYLPMPEGVVILENTTLTIPEGAMASADTTKLSFVDNPDMLASLDAPEGYILPVRMTSVKGSGASPANSQKSISYLTFTVVHDAVNHEGSLSDAKGTPVADQSGWSISGNVDCSDGSKLFDGDAKTYTSFSSEDGDLELVVDMGRTYEFDAIEAKYAYGWGSWVSEYGSFSNGTTISISSDGTSWSAIGEISSDGYYGPNFVLFYGYISARYIKLNIPMVESYWGSSADFECGYFNVYAK